MKNFYILFILFFISFHAQAYDVEIDGIYYNEVSFIGKKVAVTSAPTNNPYTGEIVIPSTIEVEGITFKVSEIESEAFANSSDLTKITIGNNVTNVGLAAFKACTSLKEVIFDDSEQTVYLNPLQVGSSVGYGTFHDSPLEYVYIGRNLDYPLGQVNGDSPFFDISTLWKADFGNLVTEIATNLFSFNDHLSQVDLGTNVRIIHGGAFLSAVFTEIIIPESVDSIGYQVFQFCKDLRKAIVLSRTPKSLAEGAFDNNGYTYYHIYKTCTLYVPYGCANDYASAFEWCKFENIKEIVPEELSFDMNDTTIIIGDSIKPNVSFGPEYAELVGVTWYSSDENVATVNQDGVIKGVGEGEAIITLQVIGSSVKAQLHVTVNPVLITSISFEENALTLDIDEQYQLTPIIEPENATNKELAWSSSNPNAVVVDNGLVTRVAKGKAVIVAMTLDGSNLIASCAVNDVMNADVNCDGSINISDVTYLIDILLSGTSENGDVNNDGRVNISDVTDLIDILLGK